MFSVILADPGGLHTARKRGALTSRLLSGAGRLAQQDPRTHTAVEAACCPPWHLLRAWWINLLICDLVLSGHF